MFTQCESLVFSVGSEQKLGASVLAKPFPIFAPRVVSFLGELSAALRSNQICRTFPDLAAFSFWCRPAHVKQLADQWGQEGIQLGWGLAFHVAPANVPLNFAYSLVVGLLSGCSNAVKLPSQEFPQTALLCGEINQLLNTRFSDLAAYITCFRCPHQHPVLGELSRCCSARILWGGDETIKSIRSLPIGVRTKEVAFANRYSVCVLGAADFLQSEHQQEAARQFYQDVFFSGQWACTAPRAVLWIGTEEQAAAAQYIFWNYVEHLCQKENTLLPIRAIKKLEQFCLLAAKYPQVRLHSHSNHMVRAQVPQLFPELMEYWTGDGMVFEAAAPSFAALEPMLGIKCQTVAYYGCSREDLKDFLLQARPAGVDRVVPLGSTMQFSLVWDGVDLIRSFSRQIDFL